MIGCESQLDVSEMQKTAGQESRADQQHERNSHFRHHQQLSYARCAAAHALGEPGGFQRVLNMDAGGGQSGNDAEKEAVASINAIVKTSTRQSSEIGG